MKKPGPNLTAWDGFNDSCCMWQRHKGSNYFRNDKPNRPLRSHQVPVMVGRSEPGTARATTPGETKMDGRVLFRPSIPGAVPLVLS